MNHAGHFIAWMIPFCIGLAACTAEVSDPSPASPGDTASAEPEHTGVRQQALSYRYCSSSATDCDWGCDCQNNQCVPDGFGPPNPDCGAPPQRACTTYSDCAWGCDCTGGVCVQDGFGPPNPDCSAPPQRACTTYSDCAWGCDCTGGVCVQDGFGPPNPFCYLPPSNAK